MPKTKFRQWLEKIADIRGESVNNMLNDDTYDYQIYYNTYPKQAKDMLNADSEEHFNDIGKTVYHPSFSNESAYSGKFDLIHNPRGIIGGIWSDNPNIGHRGTTYTLSKSQMDNDWDVGRTMDYLSRNEVNGVQLRLPNGNIPKFGDTYFGGVLPQIIIKPKKKK